MVRAPAASYDRSVNVRSPALPGSPSAASLLVAGSRGRGADRSVAQSVDRHISRLVPGAIIVAASEAVGGMLAGEPALLASAALSTAFGVAMVVAGHLSRTGHGAAVPALLALSVYLLGLAGAILVPGSAPIAAMLPILSVVLLLPGRTPRSAVLLVAVAVAGSVLALLSGDLPHAFAPMREPVASIFQNGAILGVTGLILVTLMDFAAGTRQSTDRLRQALHAEEAAFAERTAIVASLGRLERKATIEETAVVIVAALRRFPEIDLAAVFRCDDHHVDVLAMAGPEGFPVRSGDRLPDVRARHLLERMAGGPWAERWEGDPAYGQYGEAITATGILGQAFAPFFDGDRVIGAVAIGTRSAVQAEHLLADLPAVAEFAATTAVLLTPMLRERAEAIEARQAIETIIASGSYRPVFQPVVDLASGRTVGFEALTRFADGRRPDLVFAEAARTGVGFDLEFATIDAAIAAGRGLPDGTWLSLNVSPALLVEGAGLDALLAQRDRPVVLEITEHVTIDDYRAVRSAIDRLGPDVRTAVDDAGAGIANFSHLVELRPGIVKIDASLIRDLDTDLARQAVLVGLVHFAARAGCEVIAEGIETEAERVTAAALGVTHGQGYLFARPAPATTFSTVGAAVSARPPARRPSRAPAPVPATRGDLDVAAVALKPFRQAWPDPQADRPISN
jgi:EAL domain-containing protein (putative c-di-GMP-specific phosphodiesterase class I)